MSEINKILQQDGELLFEIVENVTGVTKGQILSKSRKRFIVNAKIMMSEALRRNSKYKLWQIGSVVAGVDHSTVIHYKKTCKDLSDQDYNFRKDFVIISSRFKQIKEGGMPLARRLAFVTKERDNLNKEIRRIKKLLSI
jgi:chromosomal replication initiation ATPase DnaA